MPVLMHPSIAERLLNAVVATVGAGTAFGVPAIAAQTTWQTVFGTAPTSCTIQLQISMDNTNWSTVDTSTSTTGEARTVQFNAPLVRANINAIVGGTTVTVLADSRDL